MHKLSILLGLSGSEQSKFAAETAWSIARKAGGRVVASQVVDTRMAWELIRNDRAGFVGSGVYLEAFENFSKSLESIANAVVNKFEAVANGQDVPTETLIEQGSPVRRLSERAVDHDLVVIGHQARDPGSKEKEHCNFIRYAVAEGLAHECPRPLLIVQGKFYGWSSMSILVSVDHLNFKYIDACVRTAKILELKPILILLASGNREESPQAILKDLRSAHPELADIDITVEMLYGLSLDSEHRLLKTGDVELEWSPDPDTLLVIPTRKTGNHRVTVFDTSPDAFVRFMSLPAILLWPEEHTVLDIKEFVGDTRTASKV
jgi:nucleotide-binding universal stress UspA family protein